MIKDKKYDKENKDNDIENIKVIQHVKKDYMDDKEIKNISFYINNMMYEDFRVFTDA